ncbi:MAG: HyaD/HybD family hydrogenase maturation endopeptidase [Sulfurimonas sp.]
MKSIVIGVGNTLFKDDGIGVYTAVYLNRNYTFTPDLDIIDGGTLGLNLLEYLQNYDRIIILDTISIPGKAGILYRVPAEEFHGLGAQRSTAHEAEVIQMLEAGALYGLKASVVILGIVPEDIDSISIGLSQTIQQQFDDYLRMVLDEIDSWGIRRERTDDLNLKGVVKELMGSAD